MKSIKFFAVASAVALISTAGFTSCNEKNGPVDPKTGNYNGEVVKTEFAIFIPDAGTENGNVRRMPGASIPKPGNFSGMDHILLMPYTTTVASNKKSSADVAASDIRLGSYINLSAIENITTLAGDAKTKVYNNVQIPLGTNHFLFYAHGTGPAAEQTGYSDEQNFKYGRLTMTGEGESTPGSIKFSLEKIYGGNYTDEGANPKGAAIVAYLNSIANNSAWADVHGATNLAPEYAYLQNLRDSLLLLEAGSSASVQEMVQRLFLTLKTRAGDAKVNALITAITNATYVSATRNYDNTKDSLTFQANISGFPANLNLPDGAAAVKWNTTADPNAFELATTNSWKANNTGAALALNVAAVDKYMYPAAIYYHSNSGLKTSTSKQSTHYGEKSSWSAADGIIATLYNEDEGKNIYVANNTKSVAIEKQIQYGVALLRTTVKSGSLTLSDFNNNRTNIDASKLKMTGILVGCQGKVDFDFVPFTAAGDSIIYDKYLTEVDGKNYNLSTSDPTLADSVLVLETKAGRDVLVAIEFENTEGDFLGVKGRLIPKGTKFYMVAELKASSAGETTGNRVFKQDYTTTINLTVSDLGKAYNIVPDLRSNELELGFSVDLNWQAGHTYDITL